MENYLLIVIVVYIGILSLITFLTNRKKADNQTFFMSNRQSPWYIVAIGMLGDSISGVTFVSVPGMVGGFNMTYMQLVFGFFVGYIVVAYVLLPLYYRLKLVSIYTYLEQRFGVCAYKTGASFFLLSRIIGSASKLYLVALILQSLVFGPMGVPFYATVCGIMVIIWLYTFRSGMRTILFTDILQTTCLLIALGIILWKVSVLLDLNVSGIVKELQTNEHARIFVFDDWRSKEHFVKQFLSGIFIVIVMTGLDQNMMQKNLTCRSLKDAQKNMLSYGFGFIPMNYLFLLLGVLLLVFADRFNILLPEKSDEILPYLAANYLGPVALSCFFIGIVSASFSNADSALTSLTTSFCIDIVGTEKKEVHRARFIRKMVHTGMGLIFILTILVINSIQQSSILNTVYVAVSYTYGPLLGLFAFGLFSKRKVTDRYIPYICLAAPLFSYLLEWGLMSFCDYKVGYEILLFNGGITALGLSLFSRKA